MTGYLFCAPFLGYAPASDLASLELLQSVPAFWVVESLEQCFGLLQSVPVNAAVHRGKALLVPLLECSYSL